MNVPTLSRSASSLRMLGERVSSASSRVVRSSSTASRLGRLIFLLQPAGGLGGPRLFSVTAGAEAERDFSTAKEVGATAITNNAVSRNFVTSLCCRPCKTHSGANSPRPAVSSPQAPFPRLTGKRRRLHQRPSRPCALGTAAAACRFRSRARRWAHPLARRECWWCSEVRSRGSPVGG